MKIYLDVCCLNRPYDDQSQDRIRLEAEAVISIINRHENGIWDLVGSDIIDKEVSMIPDISRRDRIQNIVSTFKIRIALSREIIKRAKQLEDLNIKPMDALHISSAELGGTKVFLTTDDGVLKKYTRYAKKFSIPIKNPLQWMMEMIE